MLLSIISRIFLFCVSFSVIAQKLPVEVYRSADLAVVQIALNTFVHTSYLQTNDFGKVACNGMIARDANEALVFDTPTNDKSAEDLINFIEKKLNCKIKAVVPTHFHDDCLGGLAAFHAHKIPSFGNSKTIDLAKANQTAYPQNGFTETIKLNVGGKFATATFLGEGHTKDNVVGYFPSDNVLFGGCLIKEMQATKGFLGDANVKDWSATVRKVKQAFPSVKLVIPGHGQIGGQELLDYTIELFKAY
jgi:metallo-beta-lactamase class B